jgi:predicted phosphodiesterase
MLKILIVSDLHAHADQISDSAPSYISTRDDSQDPTENSLTGLLRFAKERSIKANWIICPGDIAHQANPHAHSYVWEKLCELRELTNASNIFATVGNHDVDSRRAINDFDPKSMLQLLAPPFPGLGKEECFQYWAENFFVKVDATTNATILLVNSCAFHGLASRSSDGKSFVVEEYLYGRVSAPTLNHIRRRLSELPKTAFNIAVVHHHVAPHPLLKKDISLMKGNVDFLQQLKKTQKRWLLLHGHLHLPALRYLDSDFFSPVVFSAGSAGAAPYPVMGEITPRNQFYLVELHEPENVPGSQMRGIVHSWDWAPTLGWVPSRDASGLPHRSGFGARPDLPVLANDIAASVFARRDRQGSWAELSEVRPELQYLTAPDCADLVKLLQTQHRLEVFEEKLTGVIQLVSGRRP